MSLNSPSILETSIHIHNVEYTLRLCNSIQYVYVPHIYEANDSINPSDRYQSNMFLFFTVSNVDSNNLFGVISVGNKTDSQNCVSLRCLATKSFATFSKNVNKFDPETIGFKNSNRNIQNEHNCSVFMFQFT